MRSVIILTALILASPAHAEFSTFAQFGGTNSVRSLVFSADPSAATGGSFYTVDSLGNGSVVAPSTVNTHFSFISDTSSLNNLDASFVFSATSSAAGESIPGVALFQPEISGYFAFVYTGASNVVYNGATYSTGALLLRGDFANAELVGKSGASSGGIYDTTLGDLNGTISYASDFGSFASESKDFAISFTGATPQLNVTNEQLRGFSAVPTGSFSADFSSTVSAAPEPMTWLMFVLGFGLCGSILRRDNRFRKPHLNFA